MERQKALFFMRIMKGKEKSRRIWKIRDDFK